MPRRAELPDHVADRPFRGSEVVPALPEHLLRSSAAVRVTKDSYVPRELAADRVARLRAVALVLGHGAAFSHTTAARLWGAPLPIRARDVVEVSVPMLWEAPQRRGIAGHKVDLPSTHVGQVSGLPVTSQARTFVDIAARFDLADLVAAGDHLVATGMDVEQVAEVVEWASGRRGVRRARAGLPLLDGRSRSRPESLIRVWCVQADLPPPEANGWICDPTGSPTYQGDLVFREARVVVEHEGGHHRQRDQFAADLRRRNDLLRWGWHVIHVEATLLRHPHLVVGLIRQALTARTR